MIISLIFFIIGLAGYQAKFVQLGLDQLFEAPSHYLGLFVHYATWSFNLGSVPLVTISSFLLCDYQKRTVAIKAISALPLILAVFLIALLIISCQKYHWFYIEPGQNNPYKVFFKVLYFAWKNKINTHFNAVHSPIVIATYLLGWTLPKKDMEGLLLQKKWRTQKRFWGLHLFCLQLGQCLH